MSQPSHEAAAGSRAGRTRRRGTRPPPRRSPGCSVEEHVRLRQARRCPRASCSTERVGDRLLSERQPSGRCRVMSVGQFVEEPVAWSRSGSSGPAAAAVDVHGDERVGRRRSGSPADVEGLEEPAALGVVAVAARVRRRSRRCRQSSSIAGVKMAAAAAAARRSPLKVVSLIVAGVRRRPTTRPRRRAASSRRRALSATVVLTRACSVPCAPDPAARCRRVVARTSLSVTRSGSSVRPTRMPAARRASISPPCDREAGRAGRGSPGLTGHRAGRRLAGGCDRRQLRRRCRQDASAAGEVERGRRRARSVPCGQLDARRGRRALHPPRAACSRPVRARRPSGRVSSTSDPATGALRAGARLEARTRAATAAATPTSPTGTPFQLRRPAIVAEG